MLSGFRQKLTAPAENGRVPPYEFAMKVEQAPFKTSFADSNVVSFHLAHQSTTPTGTPPKDPTSFGGGANAAGAAPSAPDTSKILQALADMAKTNVTSGGVPAPTSSGNITNLQNPFPQNVPSSVNPAAVVPPVGQSVSMPGATNGANPFGALSSAPTFLQNMQSGMPAAQLGQGLTPDAIQQQVQLIQMLQAQGVPQDQWATVLSVLMSTGALGGSGGAAAATANPSNSAPQQPWQNQNQTYPNNDSSRDRSGYNDQYGMRSPSGRYRSQRSRSRSPSGYRRDASPPRRRRDSPVYGDYRREGGRGGRDQGRDFRQRSPDRYRRSASPRRDEQKPPPAGPKSIEIDRSLPNHHIKGRSRLYPR